LRRRLRDFVLCNQTSNSHLPQRHGQLSKPAIWVLGVFHRSARLHVPSVLTVTSSHRAMNPS
jgi:hypothetical protein